MPLYKWQYWPSTSLNLITVYLLSLFVNSVHSDTSSVLYSKIQRNSFPVPSNSGPLRVKIGMYVESIGKFESTEMSFDADLYLYMNWNDPSLSHNESEYILINDPKVRELIWMPDLYMSNSRSAKYHEILVPNFSMFIAQDGTIAYSGRITITVACNLNLVNYPMDRQKCQIRTLSYAYIAPKVNITWFTNEPIRYGEIGLPEFNIEGIRPGYCDGTYRYAIMDTTYKKDRFSCLEVDIYLRRSIGYHLVQSFTPTALIVMISWVSFWIDRRAVPARVTLSFTTLLSLSTLGNGLRIGLPQVSYAKALDLWFGVCMFFIFLNLLEFALVNSYMRQAEKYEKMARTVSKRNKSRGGHHPPEDDEYEPEPPRSKESIFVYSQNGVPRARASESMSPNNQRSSNAYQNPLAGCSPFPRRTPKSNSFFMPLDESPTKQTFLSEDDMSEGLYAFGSRRLGNPNYTQMYPRRRNQPRRKSSNDGPNSVQNNEFIRTGFDYSRRGLQVDKISRWAFPCGFLLFNILYWGYYLWFLERDIGDQFGNFGD